MGKDIAVNLQGEEMQRILSATALALAFVDAPDAATMPPTIEPSQVNTRSIGTCEIYDPKYDPNDRYSGANEVNPVGAIGDYVQSYQKAYLTELKPTDYSVKYIVQPRYGVIKSVASEYAEPTGARVVYVPNKGFSGNDRYVAEVIVKGIKFRVAGYIRPSSDVMSDYNTICRRLGLPGTAWKTSHATDSSTGDTSLSMPASLAAALADLDLQMADFTGATVGTTTGGESGTDHGNRGQTTVHTKL